MTIAQKIKDAIQTAEQPRKNILKLIVGELDRVSKTPTDKQTETVLLFLIKSANETQYLIGRIPVKGFSKQDFEKFDALEVELDVYNEFLPPQPKVLSNVEIEAVVQGIAPLTVQQLMKALSSYEKEHFVTIDKAYARSLL